MGNLNESLVYDLFNGKFKTWKKVLFTHRGGETLLEACNYLADKGIHFDAVNEDIPEVIRLLNRDPSNNRKIWFDLLIDDKAINPWCFKGYDLKMNTGIYRIVNKINEKCYVGISELSIDYDVERKLKDLRECKYKDGIFNKFQEDFIKYGEENFYWEVLELCPISICNDRELYWIEYYNSFDNGYNEISSSEYLSDMKLDS
jgi:hypothetical protein